MNATIVINTSTLGQLTYQLEPQKNFARRNAGDALTSLCIKLKPAGLDLYKALYCSPVFDNYRMASTLIDPSYLIILGNGNLARLPIAVAVSDR